MADHPLLEMRDIRKSFASGRVLHGVDFTLERGEIHALLGHNGAGKSTLMKILGGVYPDHEGTIAIDGAIVRPASPADALRRGVATIYQDFALVPALSIADNIALGREPKGPLPGLLPHAALRRRSAAEAAAVGIELPMDLPVGQVGVALQQMTEIVRALSQQARILVMDEPTARLAPAERSHLFAIMRRMAARGVGIVYISHFLEEVIEVADAVTVLRDGRVVASGSTAGHTVDSLAALLVGATAVTEAGPARAAGAGRTPLLVLDRLTVSGRPPVSLSLQPGEIVGLAGLVGSGRTHLARAIVGDVGSSGSVLLDGRPLGRLTPTRAADAGILLLPEDRKITGLVLTSSVSDNLALTALGRSLSRLGLVRRSARRTLVSEMLRRFRILPADPVRPVGTLSGGNAQKVLLGRAVAARPRVLLLDQPTAGVDVGAKAELHRQIQALAAEGTAILLISDDLDEMIELSDRMLVMTQGAVTAALPAEAADRAALLAAISRGAERAAA